MRVAIGSDHAGFELKQRLVAELKQHVADLGTNNGTDSVDYPDSAIAVAERVASGGAERGVVVCATGIGASIAANKVRGVRAALVTNEEAAHLTREHNDSNVIAFGGRVHADFDDAARWLAIWLGAGFEGGRHARRLDKIRDYEREHGA